MVLLPLYFSEVYENFETIESGTTILSLLIVYFYMLVIWVLIEYVYGREYRKIAMMFLIVGGTIAAAIITMVFVTLHQQNWQHYMSLLLIGPIISGIFATNTATTYREEIVPKNEEKVTPVYLSTPHGSSHTGVPYNMSFE